MTFNNMEDRGAAGAAGHGGGWGGRRGQYGTVGDYRGPQGCYCAAFRAGDCGALVLSSGL